MVGLFNYIGSNYHDRCEQLVRVGLLSQNSAPGTQHLHYVMGIDGGGSTVRIIIATPQLDIVAEFIGPPVNPSAVGRDESASRIQAAIRETLQQAGLMPEQIAGVGIGVAGAAKHHAWTAEWIRELVAEVLPQATVVPSADYEIALVGAHGQRLGVLLLAGTGSLAYGVNAAGESLLVGGSGYLLGDEGSGYWLGLQGLRAVVRMADGRGRKTLLSKTLMDSLNLARPLELLTWMYGGEPRVRDVARLAPLVLDCAAQGDSIARGIVEIGARELALAVRAVTQQLDLQGSAPAFAGSVLTASNPLSILVCDLLGLDAIPMPKYSPVIGAALLALEAI